MPASAARQVAFHVVRRVFDAGAFTDRAFRAEADRARLDARDRSFAQRLAYTTVQRKATLDHVIGELSSRSPDELDPPLRDALRIGVAQLLYLDSVPARAAVSETVELAKEAGGGGFRLANAVMRRAARDAASIVGRLDESTPEHAALLDSHPEWVARMWWDALGPDEARALMRRDNEPAESAVRANTLRTTPEELAAAIPARTRPAPELPEGLVIEEPYDLHGSELFASGALMPQSRASMLVARILMPTPGERVLDLCAAPGAKSSHIAALMGNEGEVIAVERHAGRAKALAANCERLGATIVETRQGDSKEVIERAGFDRVLLDPPCSDLGTLQSRPDVRWRKDATTLDRLVAEQEALLEAAAEQVRPDGTLVYSTCTISPRENEERMHAFLDSHPNFTADGSFRQLLPHRHDTDGFFIARVRRGA
jgi:16S rRNA (cytosine967-C5)-methyltransferase